MWSGPVATTWSAARTWRSSPTWWSTPRGPGRGRSQEPSGIDVQVLAGKGTMVAINHRVVNTVVNRCKMPDDGDIIVPIHTVAVIGHHRRAGDGPRPLRHRAVGGPAHDGGGREARPRASRRCGSCRAWAGVRPLYQETSVADTRDVTRAYTLLDHSARDGVDGIITITGGKWTSYRQMAEVTVDRVCAQAGQCSAPAAPTSRPLPDPEHGDRQQVTTGWVPASPGRGGRGVWRPDLRVRAGDPSPTCSGASSSTRRKTLDDVQA